MIQTIPIGENITSLNQVEDIFNLHQSEDELFFTEWFTDLPEINEPEKRALDLVKTRYLYHRKDGELAEGAVQLLVISRLLELAGFYDSPFKIHSEETVKITVEDRGETYRGRIDVLVVQNNLWIFVIESKKTTFSFSQAIPQALTYMIASPNLDRPVFGMVTNGETFMFIKLFKSEVQQYALSDDFSIYRRQNELYEVLRVLKRIALQC